MLQQIIEKRIERLNADILTQEREGVTTPEEKRRYLINIEKKRELENILDLSQVMFNNMPDENCMRDYKVKYNNDGS